MRKNSFMLILTLLLITSLIGTMVFAQPSNGKMKMSEKFGTPEFISGKLTAASQESPEDIVFGYLTKNKDLFKLPVNNAKDSFTIKSKGQDELGYTYIRLQQTYNGVPVFGATVVANVNDEGVLTSFSGATIPELEEVKNLKITKRIGSKKALDLSIEDLGFKPTFEVKPTSKLVVYPLDNEPKYAYLVKLNFLYPEPGNWNYFIDATNGEVINKYNSIHTGKPVSEPTSGTTLETSGIGVNGDDLSLTTLLSNGTYYLIDNTRGNGLYTYDAQTRTRLPGTLWADSDNVYDVSYDRAAVDAHHNAAVTYDYYLNVFNRNSYDDNGAKLKSSVHYSRDYNNAFWNGSQMVYGDGDGYTFIELSGALDVVAHELTHAVTEYSADLIYQYESGALNESMSDVFGTAVEFYANDNPDWLIGEDIAGVGFTDPALRSMEDPTVVGDPDHYDNRYVGTSDNGGVHWNSGIMNKAAYLVSEGGEHYGVTVQGIGLDKMTKIWYRALTQHLTASSTFSQMRWAAVQSATELYGSNSQEVITVNKAFDSVGVY